MFDLIKDQYDKQEIKCPKNKMKYKEELKIYLQKYVDENLKLVAEVPSMKVHDNYTELHKDQSPYYVPQIEGMRNVSDATIATKLKAICHVTKDLVSKAYELQRRKATEILAFVISDTDRIHDGEHPNQIPIGYALKGYSLSTDKLRQMIDVVGNKCKAEGIMCFVKLQMVSGLGIA